MPRDAAVLYKGDDYEFNYQVLPEPALYQTQKSLKTLLEDKENVLKNKFFTDVGVENTFQNLELSYERVEVYSSFINIAQLVFSIAFIGYICFYLLSFVEALLIKSYIDVIYSVGALFALGFIFPLVFIQLSVFKRGG